MFERKYEIVPNAPAHTSWDDYSKISLKEYRNLLETASDDETAFQHFFEENPSFVPGAFELFGSSGHYPYTQSLITQPKLDGGIFNRVPDFIWLAQDSLSFTPVLIEIEKPNKRTFTNAAIQSSDFTQALGQLQEWMSLLSIPENILQFYRCFDIPEWMKKKKFAPQYGLIYISYLVPSFPYLLSPSWATSLGLVVRSLYSSVSFGNSSRNGRITFWKNRRPLPGSALVT